MARKSTRKEPDSIPAPPSSDNKPPSLTSDEFSEFVKKHGGVYLTGVPEMQEAGLGAGIISLPGELQKDLAMLELGIKAGKGKPRRKSAEKTIRRNVEICDLRKENQKYWSHGQLGLKYGMNKRSIARILKYEEKWRQLASELPA